MGGLAICCINKNANEGNRKSNETMEGLDTEVEGEETSAEEKKRKYLGDNSEAYNHYSSTTLGKTSLKSENLVKNTEKTSKMPRKRSSKISKEDFEEMKLLGRGTFGKVLLVKKLSSGNLYAMKVLKKSVIKMKQQEVHTRTERKILETVDHPFIVNLHYAFQDEKKLYLVTEFQQGGELFWHLRREGVFKEARAKFYISEIVLAMEHLHANNCIYRDLKPENILLGEDGHIKLTDFGLSKFIMPKKEEKAFTICGTPEYLAPEIIIGKGYDKSVDWWSLGALLYEMLSGFSPFRITDNTDDRLDLKIYTKKIRMQPYFSEEAKSFIQALLTVNPKERLGSGVNGSSDVKSHSFFKGIDWNAYMNKTLTPPFIPRINNNNRSFGEPDLSNFDPVFTKENITDSSSERKDFPFSGENGPGSQFLFFNNLRKADNNYDGFTYIKKDNSFLEASSNNN